MRCHPNELLKSQENEVAGFGLVAEGLGFGGVRFTAKASIDSSHLDPRVQDKPGSRFTLNMASGPLDGVLDGIREVLDERQERVESVSSLSY